MDPFDEQLNKKIDAYATVATSKMGDAVLIGAYYLSRQMRRHRIWTSASVLAILADGLAYDHHVVPWKTAVLTASVIVAAHVITIAIQEINKPHVHAVSFQKALAHAQLLDSPHHQAPELLRIKTLPTGDIDITVTSSVPESVWLTPDITAAFCGTFHLSAFRKIYRDHRNKMHLVLAAGTIPTPTTTIDELSSQLQGNSMPIGKNHEGTQTWQYDLQPHLLIAGATGSGKSTLVRLLVALLLQSAHPVYLIDPKGGIDYQFALPSLAAPAVSSAEEALPMLEILWAEHITRTQKLLDVGYSSLAEAQQHKQLHNLHHIFLVVDELAVFSLASRDKATKDLSAQAMTFLEKLALAARATGIHLILSTQYPKSDILPSSIKQQTSKICFRVEDTIASDMILGVEGAEKISTQTPGRAMTREGGELTEFQVFNIEWDTFDFVKNEEEKSLETIN
ncbi:MAG: FtsK/SpoIIIE domain-containing protein [Acidibacillus sp.]|nr:FtsK/SpoIIIE domain-containing protein [Acidibacillus sp.]